MKKSETYASVWDAVAETPAQAANLRARAELMRQVAAFVKAEGWTEVDAAQRCGMTQAQMNDVLSRRISRFSLDDLVNITREMSGRIKA